jgi:hypothetical protein
VETAVTLRAGGSEEQIRLVDIGLGGAAIEHSRPLELHDVVELVLNVPSRWDALVLPAHVAWSKGLRSGVTFDHANDSDAYALFELLGAQVFDR